MELVIDSIQQTLAKEVSAYSQVISLDTHHYYLDNKNGTYAVLVVPQPNAKRITGARVVVMAHIQDDMIVIDADNTDTPLVEALVSAGVPRAKIVLAYNGEKQP
jgi:hypothetical protein